MRERGVGQAAQRKVLVVMRAVFTLPSSGRSRHQSRAAHAQATGHAQAPPASLSARGRRARPVLITRRETKDASGVRALSGRLFRQPDELGGSAAGRGAGADVGRVGARTFAIDKAVADGEEAPTKTGAARTAPLIGPSQRPDDLRSQMRRAGERPGSSSPPETADTGRGPSSTTGAAASGSRS